MPGAVAGLSPTCAVGVWGVTVASVGGSDLRDEMVRTRGLEEN